MRLSWHWGLLDHHCIGPVGNHTNEHCDYYTESLRSCSERINADPKIHVGRSMYRLVLGHIGVSKPHGSLRNHAFRAPDMALRQVKTPASLRQQLAVSAVALCVLILAALKFIDLDSANFESPPSGKVQARFPDSHDFAGHDVIIKPPLANLPWTEEVNHGVQDIEPQVKGDPVFPIEYTAALPTPVDFQVVRKLIEFLRESNNNTARARATFVLGVSLSDPDNVLREEVMDTLIRLVSDPSLRTRMKARWALVHQADERCWDEVLRACVSDPDPFGRSSSIGLLDHVASFAQYGDVSESDAQGYIAMLGAMTSQDLSFAETQELARRRGQQAYDTIANMASNELNSRVRSSAHDTLIRLKPFYDSTLPR